MSFVFNVLEQRWTAGSGKDRVPVSHYITTTAGAILSLLLIAGEN